MNDQSLVLTQNWDTLSSEQLYMHIRSLTAERDALYQQWITDLSQEGSANMSSGSNGGDGVESNHLAVELVDMKARFRKQRQEL